MTWLASTTPVPVPAPAFDAMLRFARLIVRLEDHPVYQDQLADRIPEAARHRPGMPSVLMGFDFHLTDDGPRLIEINNNAGGLYIGEGLWLPQPELDELKGSLEERLRSMFPPAWRVMAIMDENVREQFMYPEMCAYADLLRAEGRVVSVVSPEEIEEDGAGLWVRGRRLDAIYNRHTDFYLESEALAHVRRAYLAGRVVLNPHPRSYALLGDKSRMVDWWTPGLLERCLSVDEAAFVREITPRCHILRDLDPEELWRERRRWVFKPAARHGGKGVLLGSSISRRRFAELDPDETIVQAFVPPSRVQVDGRSMKFDVRLFMHGERLIAVGGRIWTGQVTNFRTPGSGWVALEII